MPRYARLHSPGALVHVIARFVNQEFRMVGAEERIAYLDRVPTALSRCDWTLSAYALMSSHVHLAMIAGHDPPWLFLKSLHTAFARFLNHTQGRFGPVFGERATTLVMDPARMAALVAYIHNNPVRAGVVDHPAQSTWTSHRAWIGLDAPPPWLGVETGLRLSGFAVGAVGQAAFDQYVVNGKAAPRDPSWSSGALRQSRARIRAAVGLPVEIASPVQISAAEAVHEVRRRAGPSPMGRWGGDLGQLLRRVSTATGISTVEMGSRSRQPRTVAARRLFMVTGAWVLRRQVSELAAVLGIADSSASRLLRKAHGALEQAIQIANELQAG